MNSNECCNYFKTFLNIRENHQVVTVHYFHKYSMYPIHGYL